MLDYTLYLLCGCLCFFFFKQKTAYEMRISDWSSDVCSSDLAVNVHGFTVQDLTVLDTGGNGIELRGVDHGTIQRVRAIWSSGGGRQSATPINASNVFANNARLLNVDRKSTRLNSSH